MMSIDRFKELIDAYGTERLRWPDDERHAAEMLLARSDEARVYAERASQLDELLDAVPLAAVPGFNASALASRITRASGRVAAVASGWRISFGWPSFAALAAAGLFGLMVGWTDLQVNQGYAADRDVVDLLSPVVVAENPLW